MAKPAQVRKTGQYVTTSTVGETVRAFVPAPLPPDPSLRLEPLHTLMEEANQALGRLDGMSTILPDPRLFVYMYVRKEAVLSAQIEGTQSSLADLLHFEAEGKPGAPIDDILETSLYVAAMEHGMKQLEQGLPLSNRLFKEVHTKLLAEGRGSDKQPGEFRRSQNWVGGTRPGNASYVPPPLNEVTACMSDLEKFIHQQDRAIPLLIKAALAHVQFETIHPFLDGNGRLGRLLITFLLYDGGALRQPTLYLSLFLKNNRDQYYELLQRVRETGDWEAWVEFFLSGVKETAEQATASARKILRLFEEDRNRIEQTGRAAGSTLRVHDHMQHNPIVSAATIAKALGVSAPTAHKSIARLVDMGIAKKTAGKQRGRVFVYRKYLDILVEGTQPL